MSNKTKWIVISLLVLAAILFGYGLYKVNELAKAVNCLYIPIDQQQVNAKECK